MKKALLLLSSVLFTGYIAYGQDITAATGIKQGQIEFNDFRKIDLNNLDAGQIILTKTDKINLESNESEIGKICSCGKYIAAITESLNGDLFYVPMTNPQVMMINTVSKAGTRIDIPNSVLNPKDQGTYFARMTTTPDGYMYALNNAGTEFVKVSPNGTVQNLGAIQQFADMAQSFDKKFALYGGDMLSDAFGNVYVITASTHVFKINPRSLTSEYLGSINGLPDGYTVNGAAVQQDGSVLLGTTSQKAFYTLDINTLEATFKTASPFFVYDLSSPYFLRQAEMDQIAQAGNDYSLFPTVVRNSQLNIVSNSSESTILNISVWNLSNKQIYSNSVKVQSIGDFKVNLNGSLQPGIYVLKAVNQNGEEVINTKFTLLR